MRYAVISDLHANLQAWNAALLDIRSNEVDAIICLGDLVGYGPNPAEVLASAYENVDHFVLGNHDAVICGKIDASLFNESAAEIIRWTSARLNKNAFKFLRDLPLTLHSDFFRCAHGDFSNPAAFNYVIDPSDAAPSWQAVGEPMLFVGHSHQPGIFVLGESGTPRLIDPRDFEMEPEKRYIVNPGSIGQPRDGEARASYCIFDAETRVVTWRRIPFDIDAYKAALEKAGLPSKTSYFLHHDPRLGKPPLRKILNFRPAETAEEAARDVEQVRELSALRRKVRKWKLLAAAAACVGAALIALGGTAWWRYQNRALSIVPRELAVADAAEAAPGANLVGIPPNDVPAGNAIPGWIVRLGDKAKHSAAVQIGEDFQSVFVLTSASKRDQLRLTTPIIKAGPGMKFCLEGMFKKDDGFEGDVAINILLIKRTESGKQTFEHFVTKEPNQARKEGWFLAKQTFDLPAGSESIEFQLRGNFKGRILVRELSLTRKE